MKNDKLKELITETENYLEEVLKSMEQDFPFLSEEKE